MRDDTRQRKKTSRIMKEITGKEHFTKQLADIIQGGKRVLDQFHLEMGRMLAESIMYMDREIVGGPEYSPLPGYQKWASQPGSIFIADQKVPVSRPRLRHQGQEVVLPSYQALRDPKQFSEELLGKLLAGMSAQQYRSTVLDAANAFGVSASSVSRQTVRVTEIKLRNFRERRLDGFEPFAIMIDSVHRGGSAFVVALGIGTDGSKRVLGFWEGASENNVVCQTLLSDLMRRKLGLSDRVIWVTDGGSGLIKALRDRYGERLLHVRCAIHKIHNIQRHVKKHLRREVHVRMKSALEQNTYEDAKVMLKEFRQWLVMINESAAHSLDEAMEELLTLHRLGVPTELRRVLWTTNGIENLFSTVRDCEHNIKNYKTARMKTRWLAAVFLHAETTFRKVKGYLDIPKVQERIAGHKVGQHGLTYRKAA